MKHLSKMYMLRHLLYMWVLSVCFGSIPFRFYMEVKKTSPFDNQEVATQKKERRFVMIWKLLLFSDSYLLE